MPLPLEVELSSDISNLIKEELQYDTFCQSDNVLQHGSLLNDDQKFAYDDGDFRQTLPIVKHSSRAQIVQASVRTNIT